MLDLAIVVLPDTLEGRLLLLSPVVALPLVLVTILVDRYDDCSMWRVDMS